MKRLRRAITAGLAAVMVALPLSPTALFAQEGEVDPQRLMQEIQERMREIEQRLARASLEPEDLANVLQQLRDAVENQDLDSLPDSLRDFLRSNPDLLARLQHPGASAETLREVEDQIRRSLELDPQGLDNLLQQNPEILERLLDSQEHVEEALRQHSEAQNDLERLFRETEGRMQHTEQDIERLIELAHQMQQQMCSSCQSSREQLEQQRQQQQQGDRPEDALERQNQDNPDEYTPPPGSTTGDPSEVDPNAWDIPGLPRREVENFRNAQAGERPQGYEAESNAYMRELARAARRLAEQREQRERERAAQEGNGSSGE